MLRVHVPPPALRGLVGHAHGYRAPRHPLGVHHGLPSRHLTLVVDLAAPLRVTLAGRRTCAHAVVGGLHTAPALIDASRPQEGLQYALTVPAARLLLGVPAAALRGSSVGLPELVGAEADELVERLHATRAWSARFALIDAALLARLSRNRPAPAVAPEVGEAWRLLFASRGALRVGEVAGRVGWSRRHLTEQFRRTTGLTPKEAARIARFEAALGWLRGPDGPPLAQVAVRAGYVDQPHMTREWSALAGLTPARWRRHELRFVQDTSDED